MGRPPFTDLPARVVYVPMSLRRSPSWLLAVTLIVTGMFLIGFGVGRAVGDAGTVSPNPPSGGFRVDDSAGGELVPAVRVTPRFATGLPPVPLP